MSPLLHPAQSDKCACMISPICRQALQVQGAEQALLPNDILLSSKESHMCLMVQNMAISNSESIPSKTLFQILPPELWWEIAKYVISCKYLRNWHEKVQKYPAGKKEQPCPAPPIVSMIIRGQYTHFGKLGKIPTPRPWTLCIECLLWAAPVECEPPVGDHTWSGDPNGSWLIHYEILMCFAYFRDYAGFEGKRGLPSWHKRVQAYYYARNTLFNPVLVLWDSDGGNMEELKKLPKPMVVNLTSCKHPYAGAVSGYPNIIP